MRFIACAFQFSLVFLGLCATCVILPQCIFLLFAWIAILFLCFCISLWGVELADDYFFQAKVKTKDKAVLITGCDSGFGHDLVKVLDKRGYKVFACCYDALSDGAESLRDTCSNRLQIIQMDVTVNKSVEEAVSIVKNNLDRSILWAVVNNAGILKGFQTELSSLSDYEDCFQVNTLGMIRVTKAFAPLLRQSKGRIVNVCSISGRFSCPFIVPYTISKVAAVTFTEILKQEMRDFGIRVISIEPEFFGTQMCSEKYIQNAFDLTLDNVAEEVKSAYGSDYIEKAKQIYQTIFCNSCQEVKLVLDAMEAAISLENPADVYKPSRNIVVKLILFLGERVSTIFFELFVIVVFFIMGLPKPKTGINIISKFLKM